MPFINVILNDSEESESIHQVLADSSLYSINGHNRWK